MSNKQVFTRPLQFSQSELDSRKAKAKNMILNGYYKDGDWYYPAVNHLVLPGYDQLIQAVVEQTKSGNELFTGHVLRPPVSGFFEVMFYKPKAEIDALLDAEYQRVEAKYRQELQDDLEAKKQLLTEQLYNQQIAKEEREKQKKMDAAKAKAAQEAEEYIQSLMKGDK